MEFKRLSDVEAVAEPTESAKVLIEENGIIKKVPKEAFETDFTDVEVVAEPSDSANVLIEEDGVIKKAPKTAVGGAGGGGGYDIVIKLGVSGESDELVVGDYDTLRDKLYNTDEIVSALIYRPSQYGITYFPVADIMWDDESYYVRIKLIVSGTENYCFIYSDNTIGADGF